MRIEETNQILRESDLERLNLKRQEDDLRGHWWSSPAVATGLAITAVAVVVGLTVWRSRRAGDVSLFRV